MSTVCTLSLSCADQPGLVAKVASYLAGRGGNILDAQQFNDRLTDRFFMRVVFALPEGDNAQEWRDHFGELAGEHGMDWRLRVNAERQKVTEAWVAARPAGFGLLGEGVAPKTFAAVPFLVFAAPFIIMRNTVRGRTLEGRRVQFVAMATVIAGFWSMMSGTFVLMLLGAIA